MHAEHINTHTYIHTHTHTHTTAHRYYYKWPGSPVERWDVRLEVPVEWKEMCKNMMQTYTERTTGSFIEDNKVHAYTQTRIMHARCLHTRMHG